MARNKVQFQKGLSEAICEAVTRPTMRFVPAKSVDQQAIVMLHRTRDLLVRQRTMLANTLRGHLAEFGVVGAKGFWRLEELVAMARTTPASQLPEMASRMYRNDRGSTGGAGGADQHGRTLDPG